MYLCDVAKHIGVKGKVIVGDVQMALQKEIAN